MRTRRSSTNHTRNGSRIIALQAVIGAFATFVVVLAPPASGETLLIPFTPAAANRLPRLATSDGSVLVARGPIAGSLIVRGSGLRAARHLIALGVLPIAASAIGCGDVA